MWWCEDDESVESGELKVNKKNGLKYHYPIFYSFSIF